MSGEKAVTRAVRPEDISDLLGNPPRAAVATVRDGRAEAVPVEFRYASGRYFVRAAERLEAGPRTALLIDDGCYHAELRGISVRGHLAAPEKPPSGLEGFLEVVPERTSAWHYGAMRKRDDA
ncbi:MAG TPA: pyridoxamine 5'-phosphate oxidase family protein [Dehalococcoidia bacterium]